MKRRSPTIILAAAKDDTRPIELCCTVEMIKAAEGAKEGALKRFSMTAYTGGPMRVRSWADPVVLDLTGIQAGRASRPVLLGHDPGEIVGHTDSIKVEGTNLLVEGVVSGAGEAARQVTESSAKGFPWQASVGAVPLRTEIVAKGAFAFANGQRFEGPVEIVRASRLKEVSFVPLGADDGTSAAVAAEQERVMNFAQWLAAKGWDESTLTDGQKKILQASFDAELAAADPKEKDEPAPKAKPAKKAKAKKPVLAGAADDEGDEPEVEAESDEVESPRLLIANETKRQIAIKRLTKGDEKIEAQAIEEGWTTERTELEVLRAKRPAIHAHQPRERKAEGQVLEAALCMSHNVGRATMEKAYRPEVLEAASSRNYRGLGLQGLCYAVIAAAGMHAAAGQFNDDTIRAAFQADARLIEADGLSTMGLTGILSNIANKVLLEAYGSIYDPTPLFCAEVETKDFKTFTRYRLTGKGGFQKVGPDGELKTMSLKEAGFDNKVETTGAIIALTRADMINDDLGAFLRIPQVLGRASGTAKQEAVFTKLLANTGTFFGSGNANYITGSTTNLSIAALTALEQKFLDQVDSNSKPVMIEPKVLLVPTSVKTLAQQLCADRLIVQGTSTTPEPSSNPHAGKFTPAWSPYLNNAAFTGYSATAWYLFANPADVAAMAIAFLTGRRVPTIESGMADFNTLGMQWRGFFDFGVAFEDYRGAAKSKGAA